MMRPTLTDGQYLKDLEPHAIFGHGFARHTFEDRHSFAWVAKRGQVDDWAIYTTLNSFPGDMWVMDNTEICKHGEKLRDDKLIRELIPCTDEAFSRYRR